MNDAVRCRLYTLQRHDDSTALETYCKEHLLDENDTLVRGCLLWNLSDVYAMRRETQALYHNHRLFETHVQRMPPMYRLWLVSDATQRLTLELGDYDDFWWDIYENATESYRLQCEAALFEAHRAAFYKNPKMPYNHRRAAQVKARFASFLDFACESPSAAYYRLIYTALCLKHFGESVQNMRGCCEPLFADLRHPDDDVLYAAGEWDAINRHRSKRTQAQIGINNAVIALIDSGHTKQAHTLYQLARTHGLRENPHIEQRWR